MEVKTEVTNQVEEAVVGAVKTELKSFGDDIKKVQDAQGKDYEELKALVDTMETRTDGLDVDKFNKLTDALTTRQEAIDDLTGQMTKRIDGIETASQRPGGSVEDVPSAELFAEAKAFTGARLGAQNKLPSRQDAMEGKTQDEVIEENTDVEAYKMYTKAFDQYMRTGNGTGVNEIPLRPELAKALSIGADPDGGILAPPRMLNLIVDLFRERDAIADLSSNESTNTDALKFLVDLDDIEAEWEGETTNPDDVTTPSLKERRIMVNWLSTRPTATQQELDDSQRDTAAWLSAKVADQYERKLGAAYVTADGVGKPKGFLDYANGTDNFGTVERTNMGAAAAITTDGLLDVQFSLLEKFMGRATWVMNRLTVKHIMQLKDGDGRMIWSPGLTTGAPSILLGAPTRTSTTMPVVAAGALAIAWADWREFYMTVSRMGISVLRDNLTRKPFVEFYTRGRFGGDVKNFQSGKIGVVAA